MTQTIVREIKPQPPFPVVGFFHGEEEYGPDYNFWFYQHPESDDEMPGLVFNASRPFEDKNQPGKKGDIFNGGIIESVKVRWDTDKKLYFWVIVVLEETPIMEAK